MKAAQVVASEKSLKEDRETSAKEGGQTAATGSKARDSAVNPFALEDAFPDTSALLLPAVVPAMDSADVLVVVDTNVLLLPYAISKNDIGELGTAYRRLAHENRLFLPEQALREFIANRDRKLAEMLKTIADANSKIELPKLRFPLLEQVQGYEELRDAEESLAKSKREFLAAMAKVRETVSAWRGDDPVTAMYREVFNASNTVSHDNVRAELAIEWAKRLRDRRPPGYKDGGKLDSGIGDFIIWKTILRLGQTHCKDLVFVTGEEKADWFIKAGGARAYPRPELIAEYREASNGMNLHLAEFAHLLEHLNVDPNVIREVRSAERTANSLVRSTFDLSSNISGEDNQENIKQLIANLTAELLESEERLDFEIYCFGSVGRYLGGAPEGSPEAIEYEQKREEHCESVAIREAHQADLRKRIEAAKDALRNYYRDRR